MGRNEVTEVERLIQKILDRQEKNPEVIKEFVIKVIKENPNIKKQYSQNEMTDESFEKVLNIIRGQSYKHKKDFSNLVLIKVIKEVLNDCRYS